MEDLFIRMLTSLTKATASIEAEQAKLFSSQRISLSDEQWNEYGDSLRDLQTRLMQLNTTLHFENVFEEGLPHDVINYAKLLNEHKQPCEELVGYLLSRTDEWHKYDNLFLEEVLNGIIENSETITKLMTA